MPIVSDSPSGSASASKATPGQVAEQILGQLSSDAGDAGRAEREELVRKTKAGWQNTLAEMDHEEDDPGTTWNERARDREPNRMSARHAWRAIIEALPKDCDYFVGHRQ